MIFSYLIIVAIIGITIVIAIEYRRSKKTLLQLLKELCTIDSVEFEKGVKETIQYSFKFKNYVKNLGVNNFSKVHHYSTLHGRKFRAFVRKKLHPSKETLVASRFITRIKED